MNYNQIVENIKKKKSFLCVGLDTDVSKIPQVFLNEVDPIFEFNKRIVDSVHSFAVAIKPNIAFYESHGSNGWKSLERTVEYIRLNYPELFLIADAKRGDIGNTSRMYAKTFFEQMDFDAITVAPYMGEDSIMPFLEFEDKWVIILALTSNSGSADFQSLTCSANENFLYEHVLKISQKWSDHHKIMYVIGATKAEKLADIRKLVPDHFLLVPGIGAQGGSLENVVKFGMNSNCGLLVNSSREILYADSSSAFAEKAAEKAETIAKEMAKYFLFL